MMDARQPIDARAGTLMTLLCLLWGVQEVALKGFGGGVSPLLQIGLRSGVAAALVALLMRSRRMAFDGSHWRAGLLVAGLFSVKFLLLGLALRHTSASHTVVFFYTAPLFVAVALHHCLPEERLSRLQWGGVALAFGGIALAFLGYDATPGASHPLGDALALASGACWGATTVSIRLSSLSDAAPSETLLWQLLGAFVLLVPAAWLLGQATFRPTPQAWLALGFQSVVLSFASYLGWFWLLRRYLAAPLGVLGLLTPLFGMAFGAWLLNEALSARFLTGAAMMLVGVLGVTLPRGRQGLGG